MRKRSRRRHRATSRRRRSRPRSRRRSRRRSRPGSRSRSRSRSRRSPKLVMYGAPWCGHCRQFEPTFKSLRGLANSRGDRVKTEYVNCDENKERCERHGIQGFPTLKYHEVSTDHPGISYQESDREPSTIMDFVKRQ